MIASAASALAAFDQVLTARPEVGHGGRRSILTGLPDHAKRMLRMTTGYQEQLAALLDGLQLPLEPDIDLRVKPFFGGAAAYANGRICLTLSPAGFALKLPHGERSTLTEQGATPLRYFPKAPVKKQYVVLPDTMVRDRDSLRNWVGIAIRHVTDNSQ